MKCLVLDPSLLGRRAAVLALRSLPEATVLAPDDPASALESLEPPLDLVLLGWSDTDDRALEWLAAVRRHPELAETPVVVLTARASHEDIRRARDAGASDYVLRPVSPASMAPRLLRFAPEHGEEEREAA